MAEEQKQLIIKDSNQKIADINKAAGEQQKADDIKIGEELAEAKINSRNDTLNALTEIAGAESDIGKALLVAKQVLALRESILEANRTEDVAVQ